MEFSRPLSESFINLKGVIHLGNQMMAEARNPSA
jgi:hypothetical protein